MKLKIKFLKITKFILFIINFSLASSYIICNAYGSNNTYPSRNKNYIVEGKKTNHLQVSVDKQ